MILYKILLNQKDIWLIIKMNRTKAIKRNIEIKRNKNTN